MKSAQDKHLDCLFAFSQIGVFVCMCLCYIAINTMLTTIHFAVIVLMFDCFVQTFSWNE